MQTIETRWIMTAQTTITPPEVLLLADHLDAVLAAGEDILKLEVDIDAVAKSDGVVAPWERFADLVSQAKLFELTIVSRALQARNRSRELSRRLNKADANRLLLDLFVGGTAELEDAVAHLADRTGADFDAGLDPLPYLRTRGVIPADAGTLSLMSKLAIEESFLVARHIELGALLDMTAALLDVLDVTYHLFDEARAPRVDTTRVTGSSQDESEPLRHTSDV